MVFLVRAIFSLFYSIFSHIITPEDEVRAECDHFLYGFDFNLVVHWLLWQNFLKMPNWTQEHSTFEEIFENFKKFQDPVAPKVSDIALLIYPLTFLHELVTKATHQSQSTIFPFLLKKRQLIFSRLFCHFFPFY